MGKRSDFKRVPRDCYPTPYEAVVPLLPHLVGVRTFDEPCAGDGCLIDHLSSTNLVCIGASDIAPRRADIWEMDARKTRYCNGEVFITNPPWDWKILDRIMLRLPSIAPTWLLLNADLMHNIRMAGHMRRCRRVVSVGRVSWMQNGKKGFENCAWYLFDKKTSGQTVFYGRTVRGGTGD